MQNIVNVDLKKLVEIAENNQNIVIYGAGILGQGLYLLMDKMGYGNHVLGFAVSPHSDHLNSYMGKEIRCINEYDLSGVYTIISVKEKYLNAMIPNIDNDAGGGMSVRIH